jgi:hypothetical protein
MHAAAFNQPATVHMTLQQPCCVLQPMCAWQQRPAMLICSIAAKDLLPKVFAAVRPAMLFCWCAGVSMLSSVDLAMRASSCVRTHVLCSLSAAGKEGMPILSCSHAPVAMRTHAFVQGTCCNRPARIYVSQLPSLLPLEPHCHSVFALFKGLYDPATVSILHAPTLRTAANSALCLVVRTRLLPAACAWGCPMWPGWQHCSGSGS